ncbi:myosin light chain kinase, smooth muscle-like [Xenia sp. Carnegie-2017]|uniref:myosin light chain kinase, smooth muscle-like n=1 Tax=Xenia sp. Carnegie-2017 TaxID=2897299 RepID=UPI001F04F774|nr:myosin light chain kinase, smooth muscle-like [Xenia sp. Carnegie-2017]XP_046851936.1 myosin light chain kinase, smooth muscle-like [Xenia sp. Carnegie-2017]
MAHEDGALNAQEPTNVHLKTNEKLETFYETHEKLGEGKFGYVYKVTEKSTGNTYAAKFIKLTPKSKKEVTEEINLMNKIHHERLVFLYDAYQTSKELIMVMELISGGELFQKIVDEDNLNEADAARYLIQILQGVHYMHCKNIVHLDLKPENVMCVPRPGNKDDIKLIDFGMSKVLEDGKELKVACGTPEFVAPEVISFEPIHLASDMWSVGVISYVLLSGLSPFMGEDDNETINNVCTGMWDFETDDDFFDDVSQLAKDFIGELLKKNPRERNTAERCLTHEWILKAPEFEAKKLKTDHMKKFIARRRWAKTGNALRALTKLGSLKKERL